MANTGAEPRLVSTLLGHAHVEMALPCLGSLLRFSAEPLRLRVHDDGTLTAADQERLADAYLTDLAAHTDLTGTGTGTQGARA